MSTTTGSRSKQQRLDGDQTVSSLSVFRSTGSSKGQNPDDYNYQRDRELEIEAEKARQQRIRDNGLGLRTKGNTRRGEIDGMSITHKSSGTQLQLEISESILIMTYANSRSRSGEGWMGVCD